MRIAWRDLLALIPKEIIVDVSKSERRIETIYGSELWVFGLDAPQRIEGPPWDGCVIDESSDIWPETFEANIFPALADRHGWAWRIGVPKRTGVGARAYRKAFFEAQRGELEDTEAHTWKSSDILPADVIENAKRLLPPIVYREQFEASWEDISGLVYYSFSIERNVKRCEYNPHLPLLVGSDFNINPMAWVYMQQWEENGRKRFAVLDELFVENCNTIAALDETWRRWKHHKAGFKFYGDATSKARHTSATKSDYQIILADERFRNAGRSVHYSKANPARADRYESVNGALCSSNGEVSLWIDPKCKALITDLSSVFYSEGTREADTRDKMLTHISDALGYVIYRLRPVSAMSIEQALTPVTNRFAVL